ncbi:MAG: TIGR02449 family protein [Gammaproteobacteria bacterium]|nr:TIGR02449 family protein [Gammaproteobacteria bacterium]MAW30034.1 TIGR02449 family protein [Gammaproteobacteria bacterium]OUU06473.1 MAG: TIGR02449 family protein [Gammaproteobacteria bacterium TMED34]OUU08619.1 MAG: TIGR02449 family protein [Gammaproteobacteria bacterium TMED34]|tara:strand:+ start:388 stop:585 length:198 start_codon:yes stop_codon:yes gene_type:complete
MDIKSLEAKVDALIEALDELERRNSMLEADREDWLVERNRLLEKNELAKNKVEAMILRLKALEQN